MLLVLLFFCDVCAQPGSGSPLRFDETAFDFGTIREADGKVFHTFRFTNLQPSPILIEEVQTTCGCTAADYPRRPIAPGSFDSIRVSFDPAGRTDSFLKRIRVVSNGGQNVVNLLIKGRVITMLNVETDFPYMLTPDLLAGGASLSFGLVRQGSEGQEQQIRLYNRSNRTLRLAYGFLNKSGLLRAVMPASIPAGESAVLTVRVTPRKGFYGSITDRLLIRADSVWSRPIRIFGTVVDAESSDGKADAPRLVCSQTYFRLSTAKLRADVPMVLTLANEGTAPLAVRKVESPSFIRCSLAGELTLQPGEKQRLTFLFVSRGSDLPDSWRINLITSDPHRPLVPLMFEVEEP